MHSGTFNGLKDGLITCGYPLIERFPLMLLTTVAVLLVGLARSYLGGFHSASATASATAEKDPQQPAQPKARFGFAARIGAALSGAGSAGEGRDTTRRAAKPRHGSRSTRERRPDARTAGPNRASGRDMPPSTRTRHSRPTGEDAAPPRVRRESPRRTSREADSHLYSDTPRDAEYPRYPDGPRYADTPRSEPPRRRPRPRPDHDADPRTASAPPPRRAPRPRQDGYSPRDVPREPREGYDAPRQSRSAGPGRFDQPQYSPRSDLPPYPGYAPQPGQRPSDGYRGPQRDSRNAPATHHPVSRVRYRRTEQDHRDDDRS